MENEVKKIGLISDTHGLLRDSAVDALKGADLILHAGDIGPEAVLDELRRIAPVLAVRGNMDVEPGVRDLPGFVRIDAGGFSMGLTHDHHTLGVNLSAQGISVLIYGHSHRPYIEEMNGIYLINPGSAGPRRFRLPVTVGILEIRNGRLLPRIVAIAD